jgi:hypothetical protein
MAGESSDQTNRSSLRTPLTNAAHPEMIDSKDTAVKMPGKKLYALKIAS